MVRFWPLASLQSLKGVHRFVNGGYVNTTATLKFPDATRTLTLKSQESYASLAYILDDWRKRSATAARLGKRHFAAQENVLSEYESANRRQTAPQSRSARFLMKRIVAALIGTALACSIGGIWFYCALQANDYFDDKRTWDDARALNTASSYRRYLDYRMPGRFRNAAILRISDLYSAAGQRYTTTRAGAFDNSASAAVLEMLHYARATGHNRVRVAFERQNNIPDGVEAQLAASLGKTNVLPIGSSFSEEHMTSREVSILEAVKSAFGKVMTEDILTFQHSGFEDTDTVFVIRYVVSTGHSLYYRESDASIEATSRPYYPGIQFAWNFEVRIPTQKDAVSHFDLHSWPATQISYTTHSQVAEASTDTTTVYDAMAQSAFDNFRDMVVNRFGLGTNSSPAHRTMDGAKQERLSKEYNDLVQEAASADKTLAQLSAESDTARSKIEQQKEALDASRTATDMTSEDAVGIFNEKVRQFNQDRELLNEFVRRYNSALRRQRQRTSRIGEIESALKSNIK